MGNTTFTNLYQYNKLGTLHGLVILILLALRNVLGPGREFFVPIM